MEEAPIETVSCLRGSASFIETGEALVSEEFSGASCTVGSAEATFISSVEETLSLEAASVGET